MSAARTLGLAAVLLAMLAAGLWIGGHPARMPSFLRGVFVDESAGLTAEASELIEDNYYRKDLQGEPDRLFAEGHGAGPAPPPPRPLHRLLLAGAAGPLQRGNRRALLGVGLGVTEAKTASTWSEVFKRSPAERAGIEVGHTSSRSTAARSPGSARPRRPRIKGPEGTEVTLGVSDPKSDRSRQVKLTRAQISLPEVSSSLKTVDGRSSATRGSPPSAKVSTG